MTENSKHFKNKKDYVKKILMLSNLTLENLKEQMKEIKKSIKKGISDEGILYILLKKLQKEKIKKNNV